LFSVGDVLKDGGALTDRDAPNGEVPADLLRNATTDIAT
jgi:hypothetical protein